MQVSEAREREVCSAPGPLKMRSLRQLRASHFASWKAERAFCSELEEAVAEEMKREERIRSKEDGAVEAGNEALHLREHERDFRYGTDCAGGRILVWFCGVSRSDIDVSNVHQWRCRVIISLISFECCLPYNSSESKSMNKSYNHRKINVCGLASERSQEFYLPRRLRSL